MAPSRGGDAGMINPFEDGVEDKFWTVVRAHEQWCHMDTDQSRQHLDDVFGADRAGDVDGHAFADQALFTDRLAQSQLQWLGDIPGRDLNE